MNKFELTLIKDKIASAKTKKIKKELAGILYKDITSYLITYNTILKLPYNDIAETLQTYYTVAEYGLKHQLYNVSIHIGILLYMCVQHSVPKSLFNSLLQLDLPTVHMPRVHYGFLSKNYPLSLKLKYIKDIYE